jgi:nicotinamidase-related amidase
MPNAVLVVDMLRGFLEPGHNIYSGEAARGIIPNVRELLQREADSGSPILFICDHHDPDDLEFQMFPPHCVEGTEETQVIPELAEFVTASNVVPKKRFSGFFNTGLAQRLEALKPDKLLVCGVSTNVCVLHTVSDARNRDYTVEVPGDCVASSNPDGHAWGLRHLQRILGAKVV